MLHRCVATNRCCPKLLEEDYSGENPAQAAHLYSNPYMHEEFAHPSALRCMQEDAVDFPPSALTLMYDPPVDDTDDISDGNHSDGFDVQDVDDLMNVPRLVSSSSPPKIPGSLGSTMRLGGQQKLGEGSAMKGAGSQMRRWSSPRPADPNFTEVGDEGAIAHTRSSSSPRLAAPGRPRLVDRLPIRSLSSSATPKARGSLGPRAADETSLGPANTEDSPCQPSVTSRTRLGFSPGRGLGGAETSPGGRPGPPGGAPGRGLGGSAPAGLGAPVLTEPRTLSRSLRDARACQSEVGAASIAAIMDVVAQAQQVPTQQRPNSDKWTQRLAGYEFGMH